MRLIRSGIPCQNALGDVNWEWLQGRCLKVAVEQLCHANSVLDACHRFGKLTQLTQLYLDMTKTPDMRLKELSGFKDLTHLGLGQSQITDEGLKELSGLKNLQRLAVVETNVTDAGVRNLNESLPDLENIQAVDDLGMVFP